MEYMMAAGVKCELNSNDGSLGNRQVRGGLVHLQPRPGAAAVSGELGWQRGQRGAEEAAGKRTQCRGPGAAGGAEEGGDGEKG